MAREEGQPQDRFGGKHATRIDYKDINTLQKYVSSQGKIFEAARTGTSAKHQRRLAKAIKRARFLGLLKFNG